MIEKIPLLNSPKIAVKILGVILYIFVGLIILGAIVGPQEELGQTGSIQYATPEGTVTVNLPTGYYLIKKSELNNHWRIKAAKTAPDCIYDEDAMVLENTYCPGYELDISWGKLGEQDKDMEWWIDFYKDKYGSDGRYTMTASGETAWIIDTTNGRYEAFVNYSNDKSKWMRIHVIRITEEGSPLQSMNSKEFEDLVMSVDIKK